ncbi:metalloproteinase inhibitor 3-like [Amphiura filiformis]|uniref:metalloproteinase inhibitor 3-like n=1 Tax=Amphiura filiformis TaxID=82378 RepID=UPI003B20C8BA
MQMERAQLNFLAMLAVLLLAIDQAFGLWTCRQYPHPQQNVCRADFVVRGEILKKESIPISDEYDFGSLEKYTVKVKRIYKGEEFMSESSKLVHLMALANCGPYLEEGKRYLLSAKFDEDSKQLRTDNCLWNVEWSEITQGQRQGLKHFYEKYCQTPGQNRHPKKCEIVEGVQNYFGGNAIVKPSRCFYQGGVCERLHSSCIRKPTGACGWTTNTNYRSCKELERQRR